MKIYGRRPLTKLEGAIYGAIGALLIVVFAQKLLEFMEIAERSAMEQTVIRINSGINLRLAYALLQGRPVDPSRELTRNPFELAGVIQPNFLGEQDLPDLPTLATRAWVYDRSKRELIYLPRLKRGLRTADPDAVIRFHIAAKGPYALVPALPYAWD